MSYVYMCICVYVCVRALAGIEYAGCINIQVVFSQMCVCMHACRYSCMDACMSACTARKADGVT